MPVGILWPLVGAVPARGGGGGEVGGAEYFAAAAGVDGEAKINRLDFTFRLDNFYVAPGRQYYHKAKVVETRNNRVLFDKLTFLFLELPKFKKRESPLVSALDKWLFLLKKLKKIANLPLALGEKSYLEVCSLARYKKDWRSKISQKPPGFRRWRFVNCNGLINSRPCTPFFIFYKMVYKQPTLRWYTVYTDLNLVYLWQAPHSYTFSQKIIYGVPAASTNPVHLFLYFIKGCTGIWRAWPARCRRSTACSWLFPLLGFGILFTAL